MQRGPSLITVVLVVASFATSCSLQPQVSREELAPIVQRDGIPFDAGAIPAEILDRLAAHRVVLVGEEHFLREHRELVFELMRELQARGFRQFLFEWAQAADWLLADFANDGGLEPAWTPPPSIGGTMITAIRDLNRTLPEDQRIGVHGIDVLLQDYGGAESFLGSLGGLARHLPDAGPLQTFLSSDYGSARDQMGLLESLQGELVAGRSGLVASWGQSWYDTVLEMVEVELASVEIRAIRDRNYDKSVRLREDVIKRLADRRLQDVPHGTLINFGSTHAQKERLRGTDIEWLGDYLAHRSQVADGSVLVLAVSPALVVSLPGSGVPDSDLSASPENELLRVMNETWPDRYVFLPLDDPLFSSGRIPMNFGDIYVGAPRRQYDAFVLLPQAHRVPSSD
jgi:hypothetical protein